MIHSFLDDAKVHKMHWMSGLLAPQPTVDNSGNSQYKIL